MKLFDCHCHVHLGPRGISPLFEAIRQPRSPPPIAPSTTESAAARDAGPRCDGGDAASLSFAGAAVMSTHPRDYPVVDAVVSDLRARSYRAVPAYGIHPWFLHEVLPASGESDANDAGFEESSSEWLSELRQRLVDHPEAAVGEIGLDGARWREVDAGHEEGGVSEALPARRRGRGAGARERQRVLSCPMHLQRRAFEEQLLLATELRRPVSIHAVRAWGELLASFDAVRKRAEEKQATEKQAATSSRRTAEKQRRKKTPSLPPKIYFHAFSGKAGVVASLLAACERGHVARENVFFGFAPVSGVPSRDSCAARHASLRH